MAARRKSVTWRVDAEHGDEEVVVARVDGVGKGKSLVDLNGLASGANWVEDVEEGVSTWIKGSMQSVTL